MGFSFFLLWHYYTLNCTLTTLRQYLKVATTTSRTISLSAMKLLLSRLKRTIEFFNKERILEEFKCTVGSVLESFLRKT